MKFKESKQKEGMLFPPHIEEMIDKQDLCRLVNKVVDKLDTGEVESRYVDEGQRAYHPKTMIKIVFLSYGEGISSSRVMQKLLSRDIRYIWISGMQKPDFRTISDFRKNHGDLIKNYFTQIVRMCGEMGMLKLGTISIDGTKLKGNASKKSLANKEKLERLIEEAIEEGIRIDEEEDRLYGDKLGDELPDELCGKDKLDAAIEKAKKELEKQQKTKDKSKYKNKKEAQVSLTDPEARLMKRSGGGTELGYNGQSVTDENQIIIAYDLTSNATDYAEGPVMIEETECVTGREVKKVLADCGYNSRDMLKYLKDRKDLEAYIPDQKQAGAIKRGKVAEKDPYHKDNFEYDPGKDSYKCPEGKDLRHYKNKTFREGHDLKVYRVNGCSGCKHQELCAKGRRYKEIMVDGFEEERKRLKVRMESPEAKAIYAKRKETVEPVFGNIKHNMGFRQLTIRGLKGAKAEWGLICIGHNLRKIAKFLTDGNSQDGSLLATG